MPPKNKPQINQSKITAKKFSKNVTSAPVVSSPSRSSNLFSHLLIVVPVLILTWIVFLPSLQNDFTNWDDDDYLVFHTYVQELSWENIKKIFSSFYQGNYHPLTTLIFMLNNHFFRMIPFPYHLQSLILHILNSALVYVLFFIIFRRKDVSLITTLFFSIHPMHVESVAWVSELKDVLYTFFYLAALIFYVRYVQNDKGKKGNYILVLFFFILSLLSKPAAIIFPLSLLCFDYLFKRTLSFKLAAEKIPFLFAAFLFGVIAIFAQQSSESISDFGIHTVTQKIMFVSYGFIAYIGMLFIPVHQCFFHPFPLLVNGTRFPYIYYAAPFIAAVIFLFVFIIFWHSFRRSHSLKAGDFSALQLQNPLMEFYRIIVFGFLFYFVNLILVLQIIKIGSAMMAERYTYVSYLGLFCIIGYGFLLLSDRNGNYFKTIRYILIVIFVCGTVIFSYASYTRCKAWKNSVSLWSDFVVHYPKYHDGYYFRAESLTQVKEYERALDDYNMCIRLKPQQANAYIYRGNIYGTFGKADLSISDYDKALKFDSASFDAYVNRAITYSMIKEYGKAFKDYEKAYALKPDNINLLINYSYALIEQKQFEMAQKLCENILSVNPSSEQANLYRGICRFNTGKTDEAFDDFTKCLQINPSNSAALLNRSLCFKARGDYQKAMDDAIKSKNLGNTINESYLSELKMMMNTGMTKPAQ
ncbi:MAG: hypothetical protein HYY40_07255 [Bacteroidetes bacterium]|nr:hypothetical protein [Bacteroidota bacterium]